MKKIVSWITIGSVGLVALLLIGALFSVVKLEGAVANIIFTGLTLTVAGLLTLNSCNMLERKNKLAIGSLSLIGLSSLLVILCFWTKLDNNSKAYLNITLTISALSVCFNLITSGILKLGKKYLPLQVISYACYAVLSLYLIIIFWSSKEVDFKMLAVLIILSLLFFCVQLVVAKKQGDVAPVEVNYVKITKAEYEDLLAKKEQLEKLLSENKND